MLHAGMWWNIDVSTTRQGNLESVLFMRTESVVNFWCSKIFYYWYHLVPCNDSFDLIHEDRGWVNEKKSMELDSNLIDSACQCGWVNTTHRHKMLLPTHTLSILHSLSNREKKLNKILYYRPLNVCTTTYVECSELQALLIFWGPLIVLNR